MVLYDRNSTTKPRAPNLGSSLETRRKPSGIYNRNFEHFRMSIWLVKKVHTFFEVRHTVHFVAQWLNTSVQSSALWDANVGSAVVHH